MTLKDYLILLVTMILTCGGTLFIGYKLFVKKLQPETIETAQARFEAKIQEQGMAIIIDSLRTAKNQNITKIQKIYIESKREIPLITDPDSLENSVNELDKILTQ